MLNHGFDSLSLLSKLFSDDEEARNRAKHSGRILDTAGTYNSLEDAVSESSLVIGTSGKREIGSKVLKRHFVLPWEFAEMLRILMAKYHWCLERKVKAFQVKTSIAVISC